MYLNPFYSLIRSIFNYHFRSQENYNVHYIYGANFISPQCHPFTKDKFSCLSFYSISNTRSI